MSQQIYINEKSQCNRVFIDANKISTVFGRDNFQKYIKNQIAKGNLVRIKNRSSSSSERNALIAEGYRNTASNKRIPQDNSSVNNQSMSDTKNNSTKSKLSVDDTINSVRTMSEKELDSLYMLAVESGETEIAQYLVDEVARRAGYEYKGFHSSLNKFTTFNKGERAGSYGKGIYVSTYPQSFYGKEAYSAYLKIKNPMTKENEPEGVRESLGGYLKGAIIPDFYDLYPQFDGIIGKDEVTVKSPEQIKSADPVTYDDNGNVIPLSERFNDNQKDIRYSVDDTIPELSVLFQIMKIIQK